MKPKPDFSDRPNRCGVTRKVCFRTERGALLRGREILDHGARQARHFRAYFCHYCGFHHLSSK